MAQLQKREKMLAIAAGAALLIFLANQFLFSDKAAPKKAAKSQAAQNKAVKSKKNPAVEQAAVIATQSVQSAAARPAPERKPNVVFSSWGRDPFAGLGRLVQVDTTALQQMDMSLRGIMWHGDEASVLIGDYILKRGEKVGPYTVVDIKRDRVICRKGSEVITLFLDEDAK